MVPTYYKLDMFQLRKFGGDIANPQLFQEYSRYRTAWVRGNERGELPDATLLALALQFPVRAMPIPVEEEEEIDFPEPVPIMQAEPKRKRGRPRKVNP